MKGVLKMRVTRNEFTEVGLEIGKINTRGGRREEAEGKV